MPNPDKVKTLAVKGGGPPPGFAWNVKGLDLAEREARETLEPKHYRHIKFAFQELAREKTPSHTAVCDVKPIEDFFELRDCGGVLGNKNVRVFFGLDKDSSSIVILGTILKKNDGQTRQGDKIRMRRRWRKYKAGDFGTGTT